MVNKGQGRQAIKTNWEIKRIKTIKIVPKNR